MQDHTVRVIKFNDYITRRDLEGLASLMTDDHAFIDSAGNSFKGKQRALSAWKGFFEQFPDYRNIFERIEIQNDTVVMAGRSVCSDIRLDGPALWKVKLKAGKVSEWRVYEDNHKNRRDLGLV